MLELTNEVNKMELDNLRVDQIILDKELDDYDKMVIVVWDEIVILRSNFIIIEKIVKFPFSTFGLNDSNSSSFWSNVFVALFESCINKIWNLVYDRPGQYLTLITLREAIRERFIKEDFKEAFNQKISSIKFESKIKELEKKIIGLRHNIISHLQPKFNLNRGSQYNRYAVNLTELEQIILTADQLFQVLCFHSKGTLLVDFLRSQNGVNYSDVDGIFESVVKNSDVYKMPDEQSGFWPSYKENLSETAIDIINKYRKKFGDSEV